MAGERIDALWRRDVAIDLLLDAFFPVGPFDFQAFLGEQTFIIGNQFRQALERCCRLEDKLFHRGSLLHLLTNA